jgi:hypothetical protein
MRRIKKWAGLFFQIVALWAIMDGILAFFCFVFIPPDNYSWALFGGCAIPFNAFLVFIVLYMY